MVTIIDFLTLIGYGAVLLSMVLTIDCRDTINCKVTIVLCNGALISLYQVSTVVRNNALLQAETLLILLCLCNGSRITQVGLYYKSICTHSTHINTKLSFSYFLHSSHSVNHYHTLLFITIETSELKNTHLKYRLFKAIML